MSHNISIRLATPKDAKQISEIYKPIVTSTAISFETEPPTEDEIVRRIEKLTQTHPWLVALNEDSTVLAYAYASPHRERAAYRWAVDVSAYVREEFRGMGIGSRLYEKLFDVLQRQNYVRAFAGIALPNELSVSLHEKMGFRKLGTYKSVGFKFGKWHDVGWWELSLREPEPNPAEPIPINQVLEILLS